MKLDVVTPEGAKVRNLDVSEVTLPGVLGEMGILPGHVSMMAALATGPMRVQPPQGSAALYAISGGYVEVLADVVRVLTETCERHDEVDVERAREKLAEATARLQGLTPADGEAYEVARLSARKAETRLWVAETGRSAPG